MESLFQNMTQKSFSKSVSRLTILKPWWRLQINQEPHGSVHNSDNDDDGVVTTPAMALAFVSWFFVCYRPVVLFFIFLFFIVVVVLLVGGFGRLYHITDKNGMLFDTRLKMFAVEHSNQLIKGNHVSSFSHNCLKSINFSDPLKV